MNQPLTDLSSRSKFAPRTKLGATDRARNGVLHRVPEESNIIHTVKSMKANWVGHNLRSNCLLKHVTEGKIEGRVCDGKQGRRRRQLLGDLKETRKYWNMQEEALGRILWRTRFWNRTTIPRSFSP